jgi:predicted MPP superfamily phosphohydrolase
MKKATILCLSDIHFKETYVAEYTLKNRFNEYFNSIKEQIQELQPTHIIINGDMVFSGLYEQYIDCYDLLLKPYLSNKKGVRLVIIPGNHCCQRTVPLELIKECKKDINLDNISTYKDKVELLEKIKVCLKNKDDLNINKNEKSNFDWSFVEIYHKYLKEATTSQPDLTKLIFNGYTNFIKEIVIKRFEEINEKENSILYESYKAADGLHGVIYDKEYNLVFACLNSVGYAFGKETFESLTKKRDSESDDSSRFIFQEYGNLGLGISDSVVESELDKLNDQNVLSRSAVILLSHVPLSWLDYSTNYNNSSLKAIIDWTDLALFGHIHVSYNPATHYRGKAYFFECPQLHDYKTEKLRADEVKTETINSLGFSTFELFENNSSFEHTPYKLKNNNPFHRVSNQNENSSSNKYNFSWEPVEGIDTENKKKGKKYTYDKTKKVIINCFDCINQKNNGIPFDFLTKNCDVLKYLNIESKEQPLDIKLLYHIADDIYIDTESLYNYLLGDNLISYPSKFNDINIKAKGDTINIIYLSTETSKLESFKSTIKDIFNDNDFKLNFNRISMVKVYIFDFTLYYLFSNKEKQNQSWSKMYHIWKKELENFAIILKTELFSFSRSIINKESQNNHSLTNIELLDIGLDFDTINLIDYNKFLIKREN